MHADQAPFQSSIPDRLQRRISTICGCSAFTCQHPTSLAFRAAISRWSARQIARADGNGAGTSPLPNARRPRRRNTSAEFAICACHQHVSVRAGKSATTMASSEVRAFATHLPISRPYGGLRNTFPRQGSIKPSSLRLKYVRAPLTAGLLDRSDRLGSIGTRLGLQSGVDPRRA